MFDHHAFGLAGGTGGVDHVGQMRGGQARDLGVEIVDRPDARVNVDHWHIQHRQPFAQIALGQDDDRSAVAQ